MYWTNQSLYNEIIRRLKAGLFPSKENDPRSFACLYRSEDGTRACLAGIMIPDDKVPDRVNEKILFDLVNSGTIETPPNWTYENVRFLQIIHDEVVTANPTYDWDNNQKNDFLARLNGFFKFKNVEKVSSL